MDIPIHVYLGAASIGAAIPILFWTLATTRGSSSNLARRNLGAVLVRPVTSIRRPGFKVRVLPSGYVRDIERRIDRAGLASRTSTDRYLARKALGTIAAFILAGYLGLKLGGSAVVLLPVSAVMAAWLVPDLRLSSKASTREAEIALQLPDVLDQLTISIEAGLGFDAAMARLVASSQGPVVEQMARVLQDMRLGMARDAALTGLADRTESPDLRSFANAMAQAGKHGLAMAGVLRAQAAEAREKRKFRAEEQAYKVPVKILMPLMLCILPTLFLVLIGPAVIRYNEGFGG